MRLERVCGVAVLLACLVLQCGEGEGHTGRAATASLPLAHTHSVLLAY